MEIYDKMGTKYFANLLFKKMEFSPNVSYFCKRIVDREVCEIRFGFCVYYH